MRDEIGRCIVERSFSWGSYLYPDLDDDTSEADELAAIEAGEINATSFYYVGALASERSAFARTAGVGRVPNSWRGGHERASVRQDLTRSKRRASSKVPSE